MATNPGVPVSRPTPALVNQSDGAATNDELGTAFTSSATGNVTALRFWKSSNESGVHTGNLWSASGQLLASVTFTDETASGWQQQALSTPVSIAAGTTYVVSVNTGNTYYVDTIGGFASPAANRDLSGVVGNNGRFGAPGQFPTNTYQNSNYFRDVVFVPTAQPPAATPTFSPGTGAYSSAQTVVINSTTSGASIRYTTDGSAPSETVGTLYSGPISITATATLKAIAYAAGFADSSVASATYTIGSTSDQTVFTTQAPALDNQSDGPSANYELGTVFSSSAAGNVTALRFWKAGNESGTHTGNLWTAAGPLLASVTFANEIVSGWQQQSLAAPVTITAGTQDVVSVNTGNTYYVDTVGGLANPITNQNLSTVAGNNGLFGAPGQFPTSSYQNSNYFRDIVFVPQ